MQEINPKIDELLERYLDGQLKGEEVHKIENMINKNSAIADEVSFRRSLRFVVEHKDDFEFKRNVKKVMNSSPIQPEIKSTSQWLIPGYIIGVIGLIVLSWISINQYKNYQQNLTIELLSEEYLYPFENKLNDNDSEFLTQGLIAYEEEHYTKAIHELKQYVSLMPVDTVPQFYLGISHLLNNDPQASIKYLENITNSTERFMIPHAHWYLGFAYLELESIEKAKTHFEKIKNNPNYKTKVEKILSSKIWD